jgi:hypothetical protein
MKKTDLGSGVAVTMNVPCASWLIPELELQLSSSPQNATALFSLSS